MDTPTLVSKYLNDMEDILDDGDSMEARKLTVEISKEELDCRVDFGIGEMHIDLTMLEEMKEIDATLDSLVENLEEAEIPTTYTITPPSPIYHPLTQKQKEKVKEVLDRKYKELEEPKLILEVLENYMAYQKKLDEVLMGKARLNSDDYGKEVKMRIVKHGLPKKMYDPGNFVLPMKVNGMIEMNTLADMGATKAMGEVKNVRIQIGYQAYLVDFLILDIPVDKELPLLLGCPFLRTCGAIIDMRRDTLCIDDGVIRHTYFPKPRAKAYLDNFAQEEDNDWLSCFEVGR
ncbi:chlorophyll A/B binding protein of LHCII type 1-like protein, partial [Tanacetum coccineum]